MITWVISDHPPDHPPDHPLFPRVAGPGGTPPGPRRAPSSPTGPSAGPLTLPGARVFSSHPPVPPSGRRICPPSRLRFPSLPSLVRRCESPRRTCIRVALLPQKKRTLLRSHGGAPERSASAYCQQLFCRGLFAVLFSGTVPPLLSSLPPTPLSRHTALLASAPALSPGTPHSLLSFVGGSLRRRYGRP